MGFISNAGGKGEHVWRKCKPATVQLVQTTTGENPTKFQVQGSGADFSKLETIIGLAFVDDLGHTLEIINDETVVHTQPNGTATFYPVTWDGGLCTFSFAVSWGTVHTYPQIDFLATYDFVISNNEFKYPDAGLHTDGFTYYKLYMVDVKPENILDGISILGVQGALKLAKSVAEMFGCTKYACDEIVFSSDITQTNIYNSNNGKKISHSLGEKPGVILLCSALEDGLAGVFFMCTFANSSGSFVNPGKTMNGSATRIITAGDTGTYGYIGAATASTVTLKASSSGTAVRLPKGRKYYLITAA